VLIVGGLGDKAIMAMAIVLVFMSLLSTLMVFVNNVPVNTPSQGSGIVSLNIEPLREPVVGSGVVSLDIKTLESKS
jgi:hypothetical protein